MFCPECGQEVPQDAVFCSVCGRMLKEYVPVSELKFDATTTESVVISRKKSIFTLTTKKIAIIVVLLVIAAYFLIDTNEGTESGSLHGKAFDCSFSPGGILDADDNRSVSEVSGFVDGDVRIAHAYYVTNDNKSYKSLNSIRVELSQEIQNQYTSYSWWIYNKFTMEPLQGCPINKSEGYLTLSTDSFETYVVKAICHDGFFNHTYIFEFSVDSYLEMKWKYDGGEFTFNQLIPSSAIYPFAAHTGSEIAARWITDWREATDFVAVESNIRYTAQALKTLFESAYGTSYTQQEFADFILGFVQCSIGYVSDTENYKVEEYYAYPLETMSRKSGDCEDTSILCSALYKALGFGTAVVLLPSHAMTAVQIDDFKDRNGEYDGGELLSMEIDGKMYYAGETTLNKFQPVGVTGKGPDGYYSKFIGKGLVGYGSYTFYVVEP